MTPLGSSVILTGATGLLGTAFRKRLFVPSDRCLTRAELDVTQPSSLRQRIVDLSPLLIINCAADTDVEGAETNPNKAFSANAILPSLLAQFCRECAVPLVHFSSTGCYGMSKTTPYTDYDLLQPTTSHHRSKAAGEDAVRNEGSLHLILRLGWIYGGCKNQQKNFVWNRIREARSKVEIASDPYQLGVPTWADDVVEQTISLLEAGILGTFNCVATGAATRYDYVQTIMTAAGLCTRLRPQRFIRTAPVSLNESAVNMKLDLLGLNKMPAWDMALTSYVANLLSEELATMLP